MAGRATLIKSLVASIPLYAMQTILLPQKVSRTINKHSCRFLWGDTNQQRKWHTVNWGTIATPKEVGGLGLRTTRHMNMEILMNQA